MTIPLLLMMASMLWFVAAALTPLGRSVLPAASAAALAKSISRSALSAARGDRRLPSASRYLCPVKCAWNQRARHCCAVRFFIVLAMALQFAPCFTRSSVRRRSSRVVQRSRDTAGSRWRRQRPMHCWSVRPGMCREMSAHRRP